MNPRLPGIHDRLTVVGSTGSGKTHFALWHLSKQNFSAMPWVILDFKREDFNEIHAQEIGYTVPRKPGLYLLQPRIDEKEQLRKFLWKVWEGTNLGIFCDEGYMIEHMDASEPYVSLLTQGRSKCLPVFTLTQRPVYCNGFIFSEASFIQVFRLTRMDDYKTVEDRGGMPEINPNIPEYHSWYYDIGRKNLVQFSPAPSKQEILESINSKLRTHRKI